MVAHRGQLILNGGSPVVSPHTLSMCFRGSSANCAFGMGFWNNAMAGDSSGRELDVEDMLEPKWNRQNWRNVCICQAAPSDLVASVGSGYQRLFVIPSLQPDPRPPGPVRAFFSDAEFLRLALGRGVGDVSGTAIAAPRGEAVPSVRRCRRHPSFVAGG
ncbi:MAG: hypothetical protein WDN28_00120 [Chthoniobacter sp.]